MGGGKEPFRGHDFFLLCVGVLLTNPRDTAALLHESTRRESLDTVAILLLVVRITIPSVRRRDACFRGKGWEGRDGEGALQRTCAYVFFFRSVKGRANLRSPRAGFGNCR